MMEPTQDNALSVEKNTCSDGGLSLSTLGLGCWQLGGGDYWGPSDQRQATQLIRQAVDWGINYFDTAELYNEGRSELFLGQALQEIPRDQVIVGTKVWPTHLHAQTLRHSCESSLRRLGMDCIDLYMIHWPLNPDTFGMFADLSKQGVAGHAGQAVTVPRLEEAVATLQKLKDEGKIRWLGLSNYGVTQLERIQSLGGIYEVNQIAYNLVTRAAEFDLLGTCQDRGIGVITYMTLMQGLLTDKYETLDDIPDWYSRTRHFDCQRTPKTRHGEPGAEVELVKVLRGLRDLAAQSGTSTAALAVQWVVTQPGVTCALVGTHSLKSLRQNVIAASTPLAPDVREALSRLTDPLKATLGRGLDIFESAERDRT